MSVKKVEAIINGQTITLVLNSENGKYEATVTAPEKSSYNQAGHYYPVQIKATDDAGNISTADHTHATVGEELKLYAKEKTPPVIVVTYPTASAYIINNKPEFVWTVTDDDSGVDESTIGVIVDNGSKITAGITKTEIEGGYQCKYTPSTALSDGSHTVKFDASDNDKNAAIQKSVAFKVDTVAPTLNVTSPSDGLVTNVSSVTVSGKTNDTTSSPVKVTVKLNNGTAQQVTVNADGSFSKALTLVAGANTITIVATDSAGKTTTIIRSVTVDTGAPVFHSVLINPNPVDCGNTYIISVEVTD